MNNLIYSIKIEPEAKIDIQDAIDYYNFKEKGLGKKFYQTVVKSFDTLSQNPFYQIRYNNIRCYYLKPFPYLVHYIVNEQNGHILGVINTSKNPNKWYKK